MRRFTRAFALLAVLALILAACGGGDTGADDETTTTAAGGDETTTTAGGDETTTTAGEETTTTAADDGAADGSDVLVGLAYDIGGRGDKSFNDAAARGLDQAKEDFGISAEELEPTGGGENREENLRLLAEAGANPIFAIGFAFTEGVNNVAPNFPDTSFAIVDAVVEQPNVASLVFAEHEGSALVGCIAALMTETGQLGFIGGVNIPLIQKFEAGYIFGAEYCNPDVTISSRYLTEPPDFAGFADPALGKEAAIALYDGGADIIYHAAGGSGQGLFEEAAERRADGEENIWAIGVDSDQYQTVTEDLRDVILTSMLKRVDVAVYDTIEAFVNDDFQAGVRVFDLSVDGVGYSTSGDFIPEDVIATTEELKAAIIAGEVEVPQAP